ncbi:trypsin-like peptidase domain-containing protein [Salinarimonas sp.]|uniref:S1C family serine protease n=1 Tax=Salinarimonas sp. TaxID=2766526 RepID=UPI0032D96F2F
MTSGFLRFTIGALVVLFALSVAEPYLVRIFFAADEPRAIAVRGDLGETEINAVSVFEQAAPSVVHVFGRSGGGRSLLGPRGGGVQSGSGFVWDQAGHVVTNNHVVAGADEVSVRLADGEIVPASIVGRAPNVDIAVLQLARPTRIPPPLPIGSSDDLVVGQWTYAIGNPFGLDQTLTTGVISALQRTLPTGRGREIADVIQTDAAINPGNSGGPLLDSAGRMIGVNTAIFSPSGASAGIGFAVPIAVVNDVVPQLITEGTVPTPGIGVIVGEDAIARRLGIEGVVVLRVVRGSPAEDAGLQGVDMQTGTVGDIIVAVNGEPVESFSDLTSALAEVGVGETVRLLVLRGGEPREVSVETADVSARR